MIQSRVFGFARRVIERKQGNTWFHEIKYFFTPPSKGNPQKGGEARRVSTFHDFNPNKRLLERPRRVGWKKKSASRTWWEALDGIYMRKKLFLNLISSHACGGGSPASRGCSSRLVHARDRKQTLRLCSAVCMCNAIRIVISGDWQILKTLKRAPRRHLISPTDERRLCSAPHQKSISKRRLRQTKCLSPPVVDLAFFSILNCESLNYQMAASYREEALSIECLLSPCRNQCDSLSSFVLLSLPLFRRVSMGKQQRQSTFSLFRNINEHCLPTHVHASR